MVDGLAEKFPQPPSLLAHAVLPWPLLVCAYILYFGFWLPMIAVMAIVAVCLLLWAVVYSIPGTPLADKVEDALAKVESGRAKLAQGDRQAALGALEGAAGDLQAAVKDGLLPAAQGTR